MEDINYDQLMDRARNRTPGPYFQRHHVIPRFEGGEDVDSNLVHLSIYEHILAHYLRGVEAKIRGDSQVYHGNIGAASYIVGIARREKDTEKRRALVEEALKDPELSEKLHLEFLEVRRSPDVTKKISDSHRDSVYIHDDTTYCKRVKKSRLNEWLSIGWSLGKNKDLEPKHKTGYSQKRTKEVHWWNDGTDSVLSEVCPDGWKKGRVHSIESKKRTATTRKTQCSETPRKWITNGDELRYVPIDDEVPEGWSLGMTLNPKQKRRAKYS